MTEAGAQTSVTRNDTDGRYEIRLGDSLAGFAEFTPDDRGRLRFTHTEIDPAFSGQGLGSVLVGEAMADVASRRETVRPFCPFVAKYLTRHEVDGLIVDWPRK